MIQLGLLNRTSILLNKIILLATIVGILFSCCRTETKIYIYKKDEFLKFLSEELKINLQENLKSETYIFLNADFCGSCNNHNINLIDSIIKHKKVTLIASLSSGKINSTFNTKSCFYIFNDTLNKAFRYKLMRDYGIVYHIENGQVVYSNTFSPEQIKSIRDYFFIRN